MKILAVLLLLSAQARAEHPVDCAEVRAKVKEHGKVRAIAWALANGFTISEISRVRKKCGV